MTSAQGSNTKNSRKARNSSPKETPWHMRSDTLELLWGKLEAERELSPPPVQASQGDLFDDGERQAGTDTRRDNIPGVVGSNPATAEDTRDAQPAASAMFEVGKPGSPYENGIKEVATAQRGEATRCCLAHCIEQKWPRQNLWPFWRNG